MRRRPRSTTSPPATRSRSTCGGRQDRDLPGRRRGLRDRQPLHARRRAAVRRLPRRTRDRVPAAPGPLRRAHGRGDRRAGRDRARDLAGTPRPVGSALRAAELELARYRRVPADESADATRHHQPARHRSLQVHDVAGDAASASGRRRPSTPSCAATQPAYPLAELLPEVEPRARRTLRADASATDELAYLRGLRFIRSDFVDFLRIFHFQRDFISARAGADGQAWRSSPAGRRST